MLQRPIRIVQLGLGAIGLDIARLIAQQPGIELVGGIEPGPRTVLDLPVAHYQALPRTQPEQMAA